MKTLLTLFSKGRSELQTKIDQATSTDAVVKLLQEQIDDIKTSYIGELSVAQARLTLFFVDTLRQSVATLAAAHQLKATQAPDQISNSVTSPNRLVLKLLQALICVGVLASLFMLTRNAPLAWMDVLLMSLLIGLEVAIQLDQNNQDSLSVGQPALQPSIRVDSKVLLDNIADALSTIDRAIAQAEAGKATLNHNSGIEEMPELVNFLQRLIGASSLKNPEMTIELAKLLPQILIEQGISVQSYQPNHEHSRSYFDFEPPIDESAQEYVTITPALLRGDRLLRRGRVIEPAYSEAKE